MIKKKSEQEQYTLKKYWIRQNESDNKERKIGLRKNIKK
jgi:hypothetical protein